MGAKQKRLELKYVNPPPLFSPLENSISTDWPAMLVASLNITEFTPLNIIVWTSHGERMDLLIKPNLDFEVKLKLSWQYN